MRILFTYLLLIVFCVTSLTAQTKPAKIWATATFNKSEVQLGEPLVVTVTVYTSTWFSKPPIFEEIQVQGSMMAKLEQRNSATSVTIGRKQYPAIKQRFVIYPNVIGTNILPAFKVITNCPPEGGYKGVEREVSSKERTFNVLAPPDGIDPKTYLAAYNLTIKDYWTPSLKNLKSGDVLERRITLSASGALAAAIPPIGVDSVDFGSIYVKSPELTNRQNSSSFSGVRTEIINYLLEEDGDFIIPEIKLNWFNLRTKSMDSSLLKAESVSIAANPDLSFILSRQKELQQELAESEEEKNQAKTPFELFGLNWWQFALMILTALIILRFALQFFKTIYQRRKDQRIQRLESEASYFHALKKSIQNGSNKEIIRDFYAWYDRYRGQELGPQLSELIAQLHEPSLDALVKQDIAALYSGKNEEKLVSIKMLLKVVETFRTKSSTRLGQQHTQNLNPLNP